MNTFLWTLLIVVGLDVATLLWWLASGSAPRRTPSSLAITAAVNLVWMAWAIVLLAKGVA